MNTVMNDLVPTEFYLSQNYPNPFSERTTIKFCVAYKTKVKLEVLNSEGELIKVLVDEEKEAGTYEVEFAAGGGQASSIKPPVSGTYFYQLQAGDFIETKGMLMIK
jgi:hypothetical protein